MGWGDEHAPEASGTSEQAVRRAQERNAADLLASGEITGKSFESALLHRPLGLKAARLLVIGAGKAKNFGSVELRKAADSKASFEVVHGE